MSVLLRPRMLVAETMSGPPTSIVVRAFCCCRAIVPPALTVPAPPLKVIESAVMLMLPELLDTEAPPPGVLPTLMELPVNETPDGADSVTVSLMEMFEPETMLILPELRDMLAATVTVPEPESPIVRLNDEMLLRSVGVIPNTPDKDVARTIGAGPGTRGLTRGI